MTTSLEGLTYENHSSTIFVTNLYCTKLFLSSFSLQFGMSKGRISQVVDYMKEIYDMGRYAIGPGKTFKRYPATAHHVNYDRLGLFTTDRIILEACVSFQYFIK